MDARHKSPLCPDLSVDKFSGGRREGILWLKPLKYQWVTLIFFKRKIKRFGLPPCHVKACRERMGSDIQLPVTVRR